MNKKEFDFSNKNYNKIDKDIKKYISEYYEIFGKISIKENPTYQNTIRKLDVIENKLTKKVGLLSHLYSIENNEENTKIYNNIKKKLTKLSLYTGQSIDYFKNLEKIETESLNKQENKVLENIVKSFKLTGIDLNEKDKIKFNEISEELTKLSSRFSENLLKSTEDWYSHVTRDELEGLPENAIKEAEVEADKRNLSGCVITLKTPCYMSVTTYANNRNIRKLIYTANSEVASEHSNHGDYDNLPVILDIVNNKQKKSKLLGFNNYAELSTSQKMSGSSKNVIKFLENLLDKALPQAHKELKEISDFAKNNLNIDELKPWDLNYVINKAKENKFNVKTKDIMQHLPFKSVLNGLFKLLKKLYGINLIPVQSDNKWNSDVLSFEIFDSQFDYKGLVIMDIYARNKKKSGALVSPFQSRFIHKEIIQHPIAFLTCNFSKGETTDKTLLNHRDVVTLFHEMGHALHHTLTEINEKNISGINGVEWDAVELPSQFHENFCFNRETLKTMSKHYLTGKEMDYSMIDSIIQSKNFCSAIGLIRQIELSLLDMKIHMEEDLSLDKLNNIKKEVFNKTSLINKTKTNSFLNSFQHIFSGGYSAGYYSYKWAEVLSADVFESFIENDVLNFENGNRFLNEILTKGGSEKAITLFKNFKGKEPNPEALTRSLGVNHE
jgi:oligopeptidase A